MSSLPKSVFRTSCVAALLTFFVDHNHKVQVLSTYGHVTVLKFIMPTLKSILPHFYPLHHVHDIAYQALLPLFVSNIKSWERGPGDEANNSIYYYM